MARNGLKSARPTQGAQHVDTTPPPFRLRLALMPGAVRRFPAGSLPHPALTDVSGSTPLGSSSSAAVWSAGRWAPAAPVSIRSSRPNQPLISRSRRCANRDSVTAGRLRAVERGVGEKEKLLLEAGPCDRVDNGSLGGSHEGEAGFIGNMPTKRASRV
jgi:hypothetical protein